MEIYQALRIERKRLKLTQKEFVHDIIDYSHYSKIERGLHQLSAMDLLNILDANNIDYATFFNRINAEYNTQHLERQLDQQLIEAFYSLDVKKSEEICLKIINLDVDSKLKLKAKVIFYIKTGKNNDLKSYSNEISDLLFESDNWATDIALIRIYGNSMLFLQTHTLTYYMQELLEFYNENNEFLDLQYKKEVAKVIINYLDNSYRRNYKENVQEDLKLLKDLPEIPEYFVYKVLGNFYSCLFDHNIDKAEKIRDFLSLNGLKSVADSLPSVN